MSAADVIIKLKNEIIFSVILSVSYQCSSEKLIVQKGPPFRLIYSSSVHVLSIEKGLFPLLR